MNNLLSDKVLDVILEDLNLKKDEEFGVKNLNTQTTFKYTYKINNKGLRWCNDGFWEPSLRLDELLLRKLKIFKLPYAPKLAEKYYIPDILNPELYKFSYNAGNSIDKHREKYELRFRTEEEAIAKAREILELREEKRNNK